ncbi:hypothetical protein MRBLWH12_001101 [Microbacterium sp. LWH12-1.2]
MLVTVAVAGGDRLGRGGEKDETQPGRQARGVAGQQVCPEHDVGDHDVEIRRDEVPREGDDVVAPQDELPFGLVLGLLAGEHETRDDEVLADIVRVEVHSAGERRGQRSGHRRLPHPGEPGDERDRPGHQIRVRPMEPITASTG